ncbi:hypothetical protein AMS68_006685 [Peltaster fructicola]|uniref:rRNA-processing protein FYV7 n=1 Tax=Peltaster fructicola TaxID=286661 RepID=A0A6H0Y2U2_9PEZI|nr:hypothetical protein AMS68_006685 [Peltaster fructicola]
MSEKRKRQETQPAGQPHKKAKHGFRVGPANLPDSTYKRHNDKIKKGLIERAQIKKQYAKVKRQFDAQEDEKRRQYQSTASANTDTAEDDDVEATKNRDSASTAPHPDRVNLMSTPAATDIKDKAQDALRSSAHRRQRKPRPNAFARETQEAERRKAEAEARRAAREEANRQREEKIAERERFRKAMAKARTADGQRKLGRESNVLLEKVKRMIGANQK